MGREEQDREDLLAEATALVERAELAVQGFAEHVVVGFRRGGQASVYFGADPAYHFTSRGQLRRAYCGGRLFKADRGKLAALTRRRTAGQVELVRHDLDTDETARFLGELATRLRTLRRLLAEERFELVAQVPARRDVLLRIQDWLAAMGDEVPIAAGPRVA